MPTSPEENKMKLNKRILHVEDDATTQLHISVVLGELADLDQVNSIKEASNKLDTQSYDLVILDFTLPDGSGQSLLKRINALEKPPKVIVLSGHELTKNIPGVTKVLTKGRFQYDDLVILVKSILEEK